MPCLGAFHGLGEKMDRIISGEMGVSYGLGTDNADLPGFVSVYGAEDSFRLREGSSRIVNFADQRTGQISGVVYEEIDGQIGQGARDVGIPGVDVILTPESGGASVVTQTDAGGRFRFDGVAPGIYQVTQTNLAGFASLSTDDRRVEVTPAGTTAITFADQRTGTL